MEQLSAYVQDSPQESSDSENEQQKNHSSGDGLDGSSIHSDSDGTAKGKGENDRKRKSTAASESDSDGASKEKQRRSESGSSDSERGSKSPDPAHVRKRRGSREAHSPHRHHRHHSHRHSHHKEEGRRRRHHHRRHRSRSGSREKRRHHRRHHHGRHSPRRHRDAPRDRRDVDSRRHRSPRRHRHDTPPRSAARYAPPSQRAGGNMTSAREQELAARAAQAAAANQEVIAQHKLANAIQAGTVDIGALQAKDLSMTDIARLVKQNVKATNATPQEALEKTFAAMQEKVAELTGVKMPSYYNPAAVNPLQFAQQQQKKKLLWSKAKENKEENTSMWSGVFQATAGEEKSDKMRKLMGIKDDSAANTASEAIVKAEQQLKKQEEVFHNLDKEYEFARVSTHLNRGAGLGFSSQFPSQPQQPPAEKPGPSQS